MMYLNFTFLQVSVDSTSLIDKRLRWELSLRMTGCIITVQCSRTWASDFWMQNARIASSKKSSKERKKGGAYKKGKPILRTINNAHMCHARCM